MTEEFGFNGKDPNEFSRSKVFIQLTMVKERIYPSYLQAYKTLQIFATAGLSSCSHFIY